MIDRAQKNKVHQIVEDLCARPDDEWYRRTLYRGYRSISLSREEEREVLSVTSNLVDTLTDQYRAFKKNPEALQKERRVTSRTMKETLHDDFLHFGYYDPNERNIVSQEEAFAMVKEFIEDYQLQEKTPFEDLIETFYFHELFHSIEEDTPTIYTRSKMLNRRLFGLFPTNRGIYNLAEVGAISFSKKMAELSYNPSIFEQYLLWAAGHPLIFQTDTW